MIIIIITIKTDETNSSMLFGVKWFWCAPFFMKRDGESEFREENRTKKGKQNDRMKKKRNVFKAKRKKIGNFRKQSLEYFAALMIVENK